MNKNTSPTRLAKASGIGNNRLGLAISGDGKLAGALDDGSLSIWDMDDLDQVILRDANPAVVNDAEFSPDSALLAAGSIDGFVRISPGFKTGLRRLVERGFADAACVVVKTTNGSRSGITHAGGRYVDPYSLYRREVMHAMQDLGMEPPAPPFIVAPGEYTLYHEWGHYVDRSWSGDDQEVNFSFRWFSRFYQLGIQSSRIAHVDQGFLLDSDDLRPIESWDVYAANAVLLWWHASSELFADLFEDWMRGEKKVSWDHCEPTSLRSSKVHDDPLVKIALLPEVSPGDIRAETYALFAAGKRSAIALPPVRSDLFGANTDEMVDHFRDGLVAARH